jgi:peptidyl-prolyl cis-trans isomerase B (cyclophilin B)
MGINVKKISLVIAVVLVSAFSIAPIQAAEKPTTVPGCKTPTAKAHAPATVKEPMAVAKSLPNTMTIDTN